MFDYIGVIACMKDLCRKRKREAIMEDIYFYYSIFLFVASLVFLGLLIFTSIPKWIIAMVMIILIALRFIFSKLIHVKGKTELERKFSTNYKLGCLVSDYFRHIIETYDGGIYNDIAYCEARPCLAIRTPVKVEICVRYLSCNEAQLSNLKDKLELTAKELQKSFSEVTKSEVFVRFVPLDK